MLGTQYMMMVTFCGSFEYKCAILTRKFTPDVINHKLLNLTTKAMIKQCKYSWKKIIHVPVHDGNASIRKVEKVLLNVITSILVLLQT